MSDRAMVWNPPLLFLVVMAVAPFAFGGLAVACDAMPNATWRRRGYERKLRGIPTLAMERNGMERAERERRSAQARLAEGWGHGLRARGAELPLEGLEVGFRGGRCGQERPADVGGG